LSKNNFLVGATYKHNDLSYRKSKEAREELISKLMNICDFKFKIIQQKAGVRPTTYDRRPIVGNHPKINNMHILNGLGSKGVMFAPYFSNQLLAQIYDGKEIDSDVYVGRYSKKYFQESKQP